MLRGGDKVAVASDVQTVGRETVTEESMEGVRWLSLQRGSRAMWLTIREGDCVVFSPISQSWGHDFMVGCLRLAVG